MNSCPYVPSKVSIQQRGKSKVVLRSVDVSFDSFGYFIKGRLSMFLDVTVRLSWVKESIIRLKNIENLIH